MVTNVDLFKQKDYLEKVEVGHDTSIRDNTGNVRTNFQKGFVIAAN